MGKQLDVRREGNAVKVRATETVTGLRCEVVGAASIMADVPTTLARGDEHTVARFSESLPRRNAARATGSLVRIMWDGGSTIVRQPST